MRQFLLSATLVIAIVLSCIPVSSGATGAVQRWDFSVMLDGNKIGYHRFELRDDGEQQLLESEASFDVRVLFFNAYRYRHEARETWQDGCLREIDSSTQANGKESAVNGATVQDRLVVDTGDVTNELKDCVMTFAYWNPEFLNQSRLLNAQSGEYLDVKVEDLGREAVQVRGEDVDASVFRLTARQLELKIWYSSNDEWLALESVAKGGRTIRYELT